MLTRRSLLRRAVGAMAAGTLAGVSRWMPQPVADRLVLPEPVPIVADRSSFMAAVDYEMQRIKRDVLAEMDRLEAVEFYMPGRVDTSDVDATWAYVQKQDAQRRMTTKFA